MLAGDADRTIPVDHSRRLADALGSDARFVVVAGAGQMVNLTHAEADAVAVALHELLERAGPRAS